MKFTINFDDINVNNPNNLSIQQLLNLFLATYRRDIIKYIDSIRPNTDLDDIHEWFGLGSVMLYELGIYPNIEFTAGDVNLTFN